MYKFSLFYILYFLLLFGYLMFDVKSENNEKYDKILLTKNNFVSIKNIIDEKTRIDFIKDTININNEKKELYIIIDSAGGSVFEGEKIIEQIKFMKSNDIKIKCIAINAFSMAFHIFQYCSERIITETSKLMSHQLKLTIKEIEIYKLKNYLEMIYSVNENLDNNISKRLNIDIKKYREKIYNDWWIYGTDIIKENLADKISYVGCDKNLFDTTDTNEIKNKNILNNDIFIDIKVNDKKVNDIKCPL
jgi:ATP-dependent protease ClpP protease subunit